MSKNVLSYNDIIQPAYVYLAAYSFPENISLSLPVPGIYNGKLVDIFFAYYPEGQAENRKIKIESIIVSDPEIQAIVADFDSDESFSVPTENLLDEAFMEYRNMLQAYKNIYLKIRNIAYISDLTEQEKLTSKEYISLFNKIPNTEIQKIYFIIFSEFFNWINKVIK